MSVQQPPIPSVYHGNASADNVDDSGWFVGQFVSKAIAHRHQTALELKWGVHARGDTRPGGAAANGVATTVSILVRGVLRTRFDVDGEPQIVTLSREGDYIVFGPNVTHFWEAMEESIVLSVRFPSIDVRSAWHPLRNTKASD